MMESNLYELLLTRNNRYKQRGDGQDGVYAVIHVIIHVIIAPVPLSHTQCQNHDRMSTYHLVLYSSWKP